MICSNCGGRCHVAYTLADEKNDRTMRKYKCDSCSLVFYTSETKVEFEGGFKNRWNHISWLKRHRLSKED